MNDTREQEIWDFLQRHLQSIFAKDVETYAATTSDELTLYEWFVVPHRQEGLDFHFFMIEHGWAGEMTNYRLDMLEPVVQIYGDVAIVSYTLMLTYTQEGQIQHRTHNESRVISLAESGWKVVHVHKSPAWQAPYAPAG